MKTIIIIAGSILLLGFFIFLYLILKAKRKHKAIKHYEELRDKLTVREAEEETGITEDEYQGYTGISLGNIVGGFVTLLVGVSLLKPVSEQVALAQAQMNVTSAAGTIVSTEILKAVPALFAIAIVLIGVSVAWNSLRSSGVV